MYLTLTWLGRVFPAKTTQMVCDSPSRGTLSASTSVCINFVTSPTQRSSSTPCITPPKLLVGRGPELEYRTEVFAAAV